MPALITMPFTAIHTPGVSMPAGAPASMATRTATPHLLHISGQPPRDAEGQTVCVGDIVGQTEQVIARIRQIAEDQGGSLADVCRLRVYYTRREDLPAIMQVRLRHFQAPYPAVSAALVGLYNPEWLLEIEATVALPA
ncbi:hypothetical protein GT347_26810 [Xylophilus rhododendri]|uniref:Uncharacterized protein n=1 Tax=Xylophilus rhododendri TaxID=2697032 RepID=A0A857JEB5_9BURK|nr:RidA family protein [Xylophilus rhododendri]QHJ01283.1 hypothetical protein GT347_26810 [Xylophilus rhododendri]